MRSIADGDFYVILSLAILVFGIESTGSNKSRHWGFCDPQNKHFSVSEPGSSEFSESHRSMVMQYWFKESTCQRAPRKNNPCNALLLHRPQKPSPSAFPSFSILSLHLPRLFWLIYHLPLSQTSGRKETFHQITRCQQNSPVFPIIFPSKIH